MQETNNEQTQPTRPDPGMEETMPFQPESGIEETIPTRVQPEPTQAANEPTLPVTPAAAPPFIPPTPKKVKRRRWPWVLLGILLLIAFAAGGIWLGYGNAIQLRRARMEEQRVTMATEHFMLGMQAQANKQYEVARQQFEYVIRLDANFPGAADKLREVMIAMAVVNTPTPQPTVAPPTLTPTIDMRPQEEIFNTAKAQYAAQDWDGLFGSIDSLRRIDPQYKAVEIDGMLYVALRNRGVSKILHQANLEGGLYDLALAEQFGPLDVDAQGYRQWARLYLNGSTFWEVDWLRVVEAFEQIYPYFPNMRDASGLTAIERYRIAASSYADQIVDSDPCKAYDYYQKSLSAVPDSEVENKSAAAYLRCYPPTATPTETPSVTPTVETPQPPPVEPTVEQPPVEPTVEQPPVEPTAEQPGGG